MGRRPCYEKDGINKGAWTAQEDEILSNYMNTYGKGKWRDLPQRAGLKRCGRSCRMRWVNYLRPGIKRGNISADEEDLIVRLHKLLGNRWSLIAGRIPGRTDTEIKNYWNTHLSKRSSSDQELLEHHKPSVNPKNQHNEKGLIPSDQSDNAKAIRPKPFKCTRVDVGIPSHLQDDQDHQIMVDTTNNINFVSSSVPAGSSSNDLFILDLLNSTEFQQPQMKEWQVAMVENYWRGSPIIAAVDPFEPNIDGEVAFNALSSFLNSEDSQYWIN